MKRFSWILVVAVGALAGGLIGCGSSIKVDTTKLAQSFQSSPAKADITQTVTAINAGDYAAAVATLKKVIKAGGLTPEQKEGMTTAIVGMQMVASQNPTKYSGELYQSLSDLVGLVDSAK